MKRRRREPTTSLAELEASKEAELAQVNGEMDELRARLAKFEVFEQIGDFFSGGTGREAADEISNQPPKAPSPMQHNSWKLKGDHENGEG